MQIEIGTNPNCSEATLRILTDKQDKVKANELYEKLYLELHGGPDPDSKHIGDWDDEVLKAEFEWSEGYVDYETIFGMGVIKIWGDAPYNFHDEIMEVIKRYLPNAEIEESEP